MDRRIFTVSEVNNYVKDTLDNEAILTSVLLKGEISNFKGSYSTNAYFTLKDENSSINVIIFKQYLNMIPFELDNGQSVILLGDVTLYTPTGAFQFICERVEILGKGAFQFAYEQLKIKLDEKGYFDNSKKLKLPLYPKTIGVVTSSTGAVIQDIINIVTRRNKTIKLILAPCQVQGIGASKSIKQGIEYLNEYNKVDLIIVARGGGSIEDLWAFNEEATVKAIFDSQIPIISAVGHETDFTLSDFVADLRASTPSEAAELSTPNHDELVKDIDTYYNLLSNIMNEKIFDYQEDIYNNYLNLNTFDIKNKYNVDSKHNMLNDFIDNALNEKINLNIININSLKAKNPVDILNKGYSVVKLNNKKVNSIEKINVNDDITISLKDGMLNASVNKIRKY